MKRLTDASRTVREHTRPTHRHTQETLAKWEVWGNAYLAAHGHAYQPPKRKRVGSTPPDQDNRIFEFLCDLPPVPELAVWNQGLLDPVPGVDELPGVDEVAENQIPPITLPVLPPVGSETPFYPVFLTPIGGIPVPQPPAKKPNSPTSPVTTPDSPAPPVALTPEPGSLILLATGLLAVWVMRRRVLPGLGAGESAL